MKCPRCNNDCVIYAQINANGAHVVAERCPVCRTAPDPKKVFLSVKDYDWYSLPMFQDNSKDAPACVVMGCGNKGTELHHFAPRHLFKQEAEDYPKGYLCSYHHSHWHEVTETGSFYKRRTHEQN